MTEMKIDINMDKDSHDIKITNSINNKIIEVKFDEKSLNAAKIYDFLTYTTETIYSYNNNLNEIPDGNEKDYFGEIIKIFGHIIEELNNLNSESVNTGEGE